MQSTRTNRTTARHLFAMRRSGVRIPSAPQHEAGPDTLFVWSCFAFLDVQGAENCRPVQL